MKRRLSHVLAAFVSAALVVVASACKPSVGSSCNENAKTCESPTSRLACVSGHFVAESCKGPDGCKEEKGTTVCDSSRGDVGDPCASANRSECGTDGKTRLRCEDGKLAFVSRCSKDGCTNDDNGNAHCNDPYAKVGDPCKVAPGQNERASGACNEDFKSELRCKDGKMELTHQCRGEQGCAPLTSGPWCDRSFAIVGDPCDPNTPEFSVACETSKDKMLTCVNNKLTREVRCGGEGQCYVRQYGQDGFSHYQATCDQSSAELGEDCVKDGGLACSGDKKSRLVCNAGKFALDQACKKGCEIHAASGASFECH